MFARYSVADLGSWHHSMYSLEENGDLGKPRPTPGYSPYLLTQILANINVFADPCISSALFSRRVVRGMNTLNGAYEAGADAMFR
jgi:hypothetical protein